MNTKRDISLGEERDPENVGRTARHDHADAFLPDPEDGPVRFNDDLAETLGESFVRAATSGGDDEADDFVSEEIGGPFIETSASEEFGDGRDESNPEGATREPMPRAVHGLMAAPMDEGEDDELSGD